MSTDTAVPRRFTNSAVEDRLLADPGFNWDGQVGGSCPVIVEFAVDGFHAQFRARGAYWSVIVAVQGVIDPRNESEELFKMESRFGEGFVAGYMPVTTALEFVEAAIAAFRLARSRDPEGFARSV